MNNFQLADLGRVLWTTTLKLALARGFASGMVWAIVTSLGPNTPSLNALIMWPPIWAVAAIPIAFLTQTFGWLLGNFIPLLGAALNYFGALFVCIGDPLVYLLNRAVPNALNVADLSFFNLQPVIFVTFPD